MHAKRLCLLHVFFFLVLLPPRPAVAEDPVRGIVYDAMTGELLRGAAIASGAETAVTDVDGTFVLDRAEERILVKVPGYLRAEVPADRYTEVPLTPFAPKALYLSFYGVGARVLREPALKLIEQTELNALVIDVKGDLGMLPYQSVIPLAKEIGAQSVRTVKNAPELLASLRRKGIYTIARIVVFKDDLLAKARPELAVKTSTGGVYRDGENLSWVDPFAEDVWAYNIAIAEEAARLGFDEIQFDYVRFPARDGLVFSRKNTEENRVAAITGFLAAARKRLAPYNVFLAADVFGYTCWNHDDTRIGQRLKDLAAYLDYVSPMLYPSGFSHGVGPHKNPVAKPFEVISLSLNRALERTGLPGLRFRPWLQAFRDYAFDRRPFGEEEIEAQIRAAEEAGANGWMLWNARNVYSPAGLKTLALEARAELEPDPSTSN